MTTNKLLYSPCAKLQESHQLVLDSSTIHSLSVLSVQRLFIVFSISAVQTVFFTSNGIFGQYWKFQIKQFSPFSKIPAK